ncbi:MAG: lysophospholipase [Sphaerochaetaceae bacterium]|nr:lysophospholipase [Sphaerochaetaceae bacterium]
MSETKLLTCSDGKTVVYRHWMPKNQNYHAIVHIFHGMAEHSARYERFANYLNSIGLAVYAQDHRGHGLTASDDERGWFADSDGWSRVLEDGYELDTLILKNHPGKDLFLFGHSMGSFQVRALVAMHPQTYRGVIVSGTSASKGLLGKVGRLLAASRAKRFGTHKPDPLLDKMSFGAFAKHFQPSATPFDWLSTDANEVKKYVDDPFCGFICSSSFFVDLLDGIELANDAETMAKLPKDMPMLIISGEQDPVGDFGKGVKKVYQAYIKAGLSDVTLELISGARHEILNEKSRDDIHTLIGKWIETKVSRKNR